jgi:hypothetical protein
MPEVARWQHEYRPRLNLALVSEGSLEENLASVAEERLDQMLVQEGRETAEAYGAYGTPAAVLVRPDGMIASSLALGADEIRALVAATVDAPVKPALSAAARPAMGEKPPVRAASIVSSLGAAL